MTAWVDADERVLVDGQHLSAVVPTALGDRHDVFLLPAAGMPNSVENDGCRADNDLRAVQDLLGHASPTTTSAYAATSRGATVRAVAAASFVDSADGVVRREVLLESAAMTARLRWRLAPDDSPTERRVELEVRQVEGPSAFVRLPANRGDVLELAASLTMLADKLAPRVVG